MLSLMQDYWTLCKPNVVAVMLVTALVGMCLATTKSIPGSLFFHTLVGIGLAGSAAAVVNHLIDRQLDIKMQRTRNRPMAQKRISLTNAILFAISLGSSGLLILYYFVNTTTMILTALTVLGYAVLYTLFLKRSTPQNIVIGGAAGAMPPLLGWTAVSGEISALAWLPVLIIFAWTPPHFWALAIAQQADYQKANIPMLPNTHGVSFTKLQVVLYTVLLFLVTLLPYITHLSGLFYVWCAIGLNSVFLIQTLILYTTDSKQVARKTFSFSITYLLLLFTAMLIDHYLH